MLMPDILCQEMFRARIRQAVLAEDIKIKDDQGEGKIIG